MADNGKKYGLKLLNKSVMMNFENVWATDKIIRYKVETTRDLRENLNSKTLTTNKHRLLFSHQ